MLVCRKRNVREQKYTILQDTASLARPAYGTVPRVVGAVVRIDRETFTVLRETLRNEDSI